MTPPDVEFGEKQFELGNVDKQKTRQPSSYCPAANAAAARPDPSGV
jgi:hypothetical protein